LREIPKIKSYTHNEKVLSVLHDMPVLYSSFDYFSQKQAKDKYTQFYCKAKQGLHSL
jgi:hypothetical protein